MPDASSLSDAELEALLAQRRAQRIAQMDKPKLVYEGPPSNVWEVSCLTCQKRFESNSPRNKNCAECAGLPTFGSTFVPPITTELRGKEAKFSDKEPGSETKSKKE